MTADPSSTAHPPLDPAHAARLQAVCDEGWSLFETFEAALRPGDAHPFISADYEVVRDALVQVRQPGARFLEWGSATGTITILASLLGFDACGIELDGQLVATARAFATRAGSNARFAHGSYVPTGYRWPPAPGRGEQTTGDGASGYLPLGHALDDFDVVFGYPWPGEAPKMLDLMRHHGRRGALLLLNDIDAGVRAYRDGREVPLAAALSRRAFVVAGGAIVLAARSSATVRVCVRATHDVVLRGGAVFDGSGSEGRELDVAISGGRIVELGGSLAARGTVEVDVRGLAVSPGFIDIHSHGDDTLAADPRAESVIRQGITTIVVGADGSSRASGDTRDGFAAMFATLAALRPSPNVASMIGLGTVRGAVVGNDDRPASAAELQRMVAMVERALADGACGASSGLEYTPGAFASTAELVALCRPLAPRGLAYATHMRNEDDRLLEAITESIAVARGARCALQVSHLKTQGPRNWGKLPQVFAQLEAARAEGLDVAFDRYPYLAYATGLTNLFPVWSRDGGTRAFLARLQDTSLAPRIEAAVRAKVELIGGWDNVQVTAVRSAADRDAEGKRLGAWAQATRMEPYAALLGLMRRNDASVDMAGFAMSEENLERLLADPHGMVCTDGGAFAIDGPTRRGSPHPRGAGSFPRVLARYVRERKVITLATAIRKFTSQPAERLKLAGRGRLVAGAAADVVVFDPARVADTATFEQPFQYPVGIPHVLVNGRFALRDGQRTPDRAGRPLRSTGARAG